MAVSHELASPFLQGDGRDAVGLATGGTPVVPVAGSGLAKTLQNAKFPLSAMRRRGNIWAAAAGRARP